MHVTNLQQVVTWAEEKAPRLDARWDRVAGTSNTRVQVTPDEVDEIAAAIEAALAPYVQRAEHDLPEGARSVRFLRYHMPEPSDDD